MLPGADELVTRRRRAGVEPLRHDARGRAALHGTPDASGREAFGVTHRVTHRGCRFRTICMDPRPTRGQRARLARKNSRMCDGDAGSTQKSWRPLSRACRRPCEWWCPVRQRSTAPRGSI